MPTIPYRQKAGNRVKGVTTIMGQVLAKPALTFWAYNMGMENFNRITEMIAKVCGEESPDVEAFRLKILNTLREFEPAPLYDKRDKAATAGTLGHLYVENHLKKLPEPSMLEFWREHSVTPKIQRKDIEKKAEGCYLAFLEWERSHKFKLVHSELSLTSEKYPFGGTLDIGAVLGEMGILDLKTSKDIYYSMLIQDSAYGHLYNEFYPDNPVQGYHILRVGEDGGFEHKYQPELEAEWQIFLNCLNISLILDAKGKKL